MKKIFLAAFVAFSAIAFTSCGDNDSDSSSNNGTENVLLKKIVETYDGENYTSTFEYSGNKLVRISNSDGTIEQFTYNGDKITQRFITAGQTEDHTQKDTYVYDSEGRLASYIMFLDYEDNSSDLEDKRLYTYNTDGTISVKTYLGNGTIPAELSSTGTITLRDGNILSYIGTNRQETYTYDNKKNPFKNILGYSSTIISYTEGGVNNALTYRYIDSPSVPYTENTVYTYNSNGYPSADTTTDSDGEVITTQYFY